MDIKQAILSVEGLSFPGRTYTEVVLKPAFDQAKINLLEPMIAIHKAHLIMLTEQGLLDPQEAAKIRDAIQHLDLTQMQDSEYDGQFEDLFFLVENSIMQFSGEVGGSLHLARSRNDMGVAMYRMTLRQKLLQVLESIAKFQDIVITVANEHVDTIMLGYTHTQQAQPTTLAHYLVAVFDSMSRDLVRIRAAYSTVNHSPLGAAALTTTGFRIDRQRVSELLGFSGMVENSYDAIAGADYLGESAASLQLLMVGVGRLVQDLLLWSTQEFGAVKVADPYVQISSIMPQKRNPVSLEHVRALSSSVIGRADTVLRMLHNTPFGDIVDTEDDLQSHLWEGLHLADQVLRLLGVVIGTLNVDRERLLQRARVSFATITELADTLVRERSLPFRSAHAIASFVVKMTLANGGDASQITTNTVDNAAEQVIGRPLELSPEMVKMVMDPSHFVSIRDLPGGPAGSEVKRALNERIQGLKSIQSEIQTESERLVQTLSRLNP